MRDGDTRARFVIGIVLLLLSGPLVVPAVEWGGPRTVWLVVWVTAVGFVSYPLASLWRVSTRRGRRRETGPASRA
ncbi:hypothetical protein [Streptomyces zingiberis]|uniref:DUF3311 domain-containing protein n=1 Tax=Streptomyces zingiberis TaxID=2053010 RepID=A0ABX1BUA8_9ACTN|nr:hypothetical protein [Streptomyces zingiberis]NJQ01266.1 hypothetical protein [Streptomyces zingiberis]